MRYLFPVMMMSCCTNTLPAQIAKSLHVQEHVLSNGLTVWLNEDHTQPKVFGAVLVKAGAKDSPNTGIAHYFEHMMFKGTDKIGTVDYISEKVYLDSITAGYDKLARTEDQKEREIIQQEINELSVKAADYVIPNEFDRLISKYGGTKLNAGTSYDYTVYFNTFSPQYIHHWAEINSERLINPVFRLFQNELETVYEEKNMYGDFVGSQAIEKLTERYFHPHPYAYPIIGSTEHLKNPSLTEMRKFFETYYVASNMGLILSGDFDSQTVLPILEQTFSRIREGQVPDRQPVELPPFEGREKIEVKAPIPFVGVMGFAFRGVPANHPDQAALNIAVTLLNNSNGTGYLDRLTVNHKVLSSMALNESMNEAGILGVVVVPKMVIQTYNAAEKLAWAEIERIKNGDFDEEFFQSLKLEQLREYTSGLEDIASRAQVMMRIFSQGKSWEEYMREVARIDAITKEDVVAVARKYFSDNYLYVTKKTGKYPKENLPKPNYKPVTPKNTDVQSEYAKQLEQIPVKQVQPHFLDFEKDVQSTSLNALVTLYATSNPVNDIFTLKIAYGIGCIEKPELSLLASYMNFLGTEELTFEEFRRRLQIVGSTLSFETNDTDFVVKITGFDSHFSETMKLIGTFLRTPKADDKKMRQVIDEAKVMEKTFLKTGDQVAAALLEKVKFGDQSRYLTRLPLAKIKKLKGQHLIDQFERVKQVESTIHYCGKLPLEQIVEQIKQSIPIEQVARPSQSPYYRETRQYDKPTVFFLDMSDLTQSIIYSYVKGGVLPDERSLYTSKLFTGYFGGDMSSLMFQEIREFRSYAYRVSARYNQPPLKLLQQPGDFVTMLSTQADKTLDALGVLNTLIQTMPERPDRVEAIKQSILNHVNNEYPSFRNLSSKVASFRRDGYSEDPNKSYLESIRAMEMGDITRFYQENIKGKPIVYVVVGNSKRINMKELAAFGTIVELKKKDIYNK
ncbi:M16 family metallopeptidase [Parabacteroides sp. PF5-9]|uniref:M16 family metallopeptidase n=1 Tax=Parabacteroides sp. PF5-9 TaxID=1742404 RepID=UPI002473BE0E|nr:M16 family metallopeptidase [Parabacteroides sp. PF5-9]MDH6358325.1 putative Zn-dependent peptidase [Parabacteroides sp. PF5-9]